MSVIEAMDAWKHESELGDFITETNTFPTTALAPTLNHQSSHDQEDIDAYHLTLEQVHRAEFYLHRNREEKVHIQHLISSLKGAAEISPAMDIVAQYERLQPLMALAFWMPVGYLQSCHGSPGSLIVIAHLYTVTILMARLFPKSGVGYCGSLSVRPLEEIASRLQTYLDSSHTDHRTDGGSQQRMPLTLVEFPIAMLGHLRSHR
ncbi:hypothetical protein PLIIFM63780_002288 [Purpureocillium lilacinum]|nr:hypothetical protein PLIIFM63780_002288 [Purpureocillium lilacinum]